MRACASGEEANPRRSSRSVSNSSARAELWDRSQGIADLCYRSAGQPEGEARGEVREAGCKPEGILKLALIGFSFRDRILWSCPGFAASFFASFASPSRTLRLGVSAPSLGAQRLH